MLPDLSTFRRSIREQIAINQARTPTERFLALCDLLDTIRAMAPQTPEARQARRQAMARRQQAHEELREFCRRHIALERARAAGGV
jgi:hypothetical protein